MVRQLLNLANNESLSPNLMLLLFTWFSCNLLLTIIIHYGILVQLIIIIIIIIIMQER